MRNTKIPASRCPYCGHKLDGALHDGDAVPVPGNLSICIECAALLCFGADLRLRTLTGAEMRRLRVSPTWPQIKLYREALRRAKRRTGEGH